jgi:uncharacterized coiled-coil protein SlyX
MTRIIINTQAYLQSYILRCENELRVYQVQYPDLDAAGSVVDIGGGVDAADMPPWLLEARHTAPLLVAYEKRVKDLQERCALQSNELTDLRGVVDALAKSKRQVEGELQHNIGALIDRFDELDANDDDADNVEVARRRRRAAERNIELAEMEEKSKLFQQQRDLLRQQVRPHLLFYCSHDVLLCSRLVTCAHKAHDTYVQHSLF